MILDLNFHGKRPCRWEDTIKMCFVEVGCEGVDWIQLAQDMDHWLAHVNMVMNLLVS